MTAGRSEPYAIHWFRRDLRIGGNPSLQWAWKQYRGRVVGLFCFDTKFLSRSDFSHDRFGFFLNTLKTLQDEMHEAGSELLVLDRMPLAAFDLLLPALRRSTGSAPGHLTFNRDYEPFATARDFDVQKRIETGHGVPVRTERDHLLIEPGEIPPYKVYTPFMKRWLELVKSESVIQRILSQKPPAGPAASRKQIFQLTWNELLGEHKPQDQLDAFITKNRPLVSVPLPPPGARCAQERARHFKTRLHDYAKNRDYPSIDGTSGLSVYFKNGSITPAQALQALEQEDKLDARNIFVKEIAWREFFYHVLAHHPHVESGAFQEKYNAVKWENRDDWFAAWTEGRTGFPIVDAGMRQLRSTGLMHNRVRMIVASFLTKDLLIDWRRGERYFMKHLLDGDLAANNGGWQWAASTGCDAQPYFRIFNPALQSKKFDPEARYIRQHVPELSTVDLSEIHTVAPRTRRGGYPKPIVDHAEQRLKALQLYKKLG